MLPLFNKFLSHRNDRGYTVAELVIVITVFSILTPVVLFGLGNFYDDHVATLNSASQEADTQYSLNSVATDLRATAGFRASLDVANVAPLGSNNNATGSYGWSYCGIATTSTTCDGVTSNDNTTNRVLIAYTYATDGAVTGSTTMPVFINDGSPSFNLSTAKPATNAVIYFVAPDRSDATRNNLYKRTIVDVNSTTNVYRNISAATGLWPCATSNPSPSGCTTPYQKTTCASTMISSYASLCGASDSVIMRNVKSFWVDYYDSTNQPIANYYTSNAVNAAAAATAIQNSAASIKITVTKKPANGTTAKVMSINIAKQ